MEVDLRGGGGRGGMAVGRDLGGGGKEGRCSLLVGCWRAGAVSGVGFGEGRRGWK